MVGSHFNSKNITFSRFFEVEDFFLVDCLFFTVIQIYKSVLPRFFKCSKPTMIWNDASLVFSSYLSDLSGCSVLIRSDIFVSYFLPFGYQPKHINTTSSCILFPNRNSC